MIVICFVDPRGAGIWDGKPLASTEAAIWAMDADEAGERGLVSLNHC